jgi:DNA polymerase-3 subunit delta'
VDFLSASSMPWLRQAQARVQQARANGRLPHSLLILSVPGLGAELLANWISAYILCASADSKPCGACGSCRLLAADSHPDHHRIGLEEGSQQIKVEQVRELMEPLTLKSYRGGYKIGVIEDAETLNTFGANAFLKTLEEPSADTVLMVIARPNHRLPVTLSSRCLRLVLRAPPSAEASAWLDANSTVKRPWTAALALAGGAPLQALKLDPAALAALDEDMRACIGQLAAGSVDISLLAEKWLRSNPELRIKWLENWVTWRVHACFAAPNSHQSAEPVVLSGALLKPKITPLFGLLDAARGFRRLAATGMNQQLALEALLIEGRNALAIQREIG